ncbi:MAG TPA: hypothetical protein VIM12_13360 [Noviherbaspirillum sp.]|jgi:hypothetical protein|uniref:hypothetical protein n=1 Tax=Noviherbaspirillum sp. TaxID=1926288 RepID=UPI002F94A114
MKHMPHTDIERTVARDGEMPGQPSSDTPHGLQSLESWAAAQERYKKLVTGLDPAMSETARRVIEEYLQRAEETKRVRAAHDVFSLEQMITNIHVNNDSFIRDSVTGK